MAQLPFFVGIGAQKAGTTWLHDQLSVHPEVALPSGKEVHYFDSLALTRSGHNYSNNELGLAKAALAKGRLGQVRRQLEKFEVYLNGDEHYRRYLCRAANPQTKIIGEITPGYSTLSREGFMRMEAALAPRVIFIMRDPLERYWSFVRMAERDDKRLPDLFQRAYRNPAIWDRSDYESTVRLVDGIFPSDRVLYLFYESMINEDGLRRVASFLGVSPEWNWKANQKSRVGRERPMPAPSRELMERFRPVYDYVHQRFGDAVPESWHDVSDGLGSSEGSGIA